MKKYFIAFLFAGSLISCGSSDTTTETITDTTNFTPAPDTATRFMPVPDSVSPTSSIQNSSALPASVTQPLTSGKQALNPEHGQPGHRCDIPVGTPLNAQSSDVTVNPVSAPQPVTSSAPSNGTVKLNPAHGQPGHDCAVEVGKPLKN